MISILLALVVGTWNGNWFPSGQCDYRDRPEVESERIGAAGRILAGGLAKADPTGREEIVLVLNEMRDTASVEKLLGAIGRENLKIASITGYRLGDRADEQQDVVVTTLPVVKSRWARWRYNAEANPPRGYAFASVAVAPAVTARVYAVHLKANGGGDDSSVATTNRLKRANAIGQFLKIEKGTNPVILAGDFNADKWRTEFADETIFSDLERAGYENLLERLPPQKRVTHPNRRHGNSALDYIMVKGLVSVGDPILVSSKGLSDHCALFVRVEPPVSSSRPRSELR